MPKLFHLDAVTGDCVKGWAHDTDDPTRHIQVEILADGVPVGSIVAKEGRRDLEARGFVHTRVGFRVALPAACLDGSDHEFTVREVGASQIGDEFRRILRTTKPAFATAAERPWFDPLPHEPGRPGSESLRSSIRGDSELRRLLSLFRENRMDEAVGVARKLFRGNRDLFGIDTGIVDAVLTHTGVKSFQQLIADRTHDWFETSNRSLWQRRLVMKHDMRGFALRNDVGVPELYARFSRPEELLELELPERYVAKPDDLASAKGVFAVADGVNLFTGGPVTPAQIVRSWKRLAASTGRAQAFMVEELVADRFAPHSDLIPLDYKIYVFGGTAGFLEVFDRNYPGPTRTPYSLSWRPLPHSLQVRSARGPAIRPPDNLDQLIEVAERLGRDFRYFCRVDMFNTPRGPLLGEITVLPANGTGRTYYADRIAQQGFIVFEDQQIWVAD